MNQCSDQKKRMPAVSIIIPTYNRKKLLMYTLDSILKQSISLDLIQVIVVDDGSSDDTAEMVRPYFEEINFKYFFQEDKGYNQKGFFRF
jgi:glycosyltransferase involved in cell wall biosynthesis